MWAEDRRARDTRDTWAHDTRDTWAGDRRAHDTHDTWAGDRRAHEAHVIGLFLCHQGPERAGLCWTLIVESLLWGSRNWRLPEGKQMAEGMLRAESTLVTPHPQRLGWGLRPGKGSRRGQPYVHNNTPKLRTHREAGSIQCWISTGLTRTLG